MKPESLFIPLYLSFGDLLILDHRLAPRVSIELPRLYELDVPRFFKSHRPLRPSQPGALIKTAARARRADGLFLTSVRQQWCTKISRKICIGLPVCEKLYWIGPPSLSGLKAPGPLQVFDCPRPSGHTPACANTLRLSRPSPLSSSWMDLLLTSSTPNSSPELLMPLRKNWVVANCLHVRQRCLSLNKFVNSIAVQVGSVLNLAPNHVHQSPISIANGNGCDISTCDTRGASN